MVPVRLSAVGHGKRLVGRRTKARRQPSVESLAA